MLVKQAHKQLEDEVLEDMEVAQKLKEMVRKDDENDFIALLVEFEQELKELRSVANEMIKTGANYKAPIEDFVEQKLQQKPAPLQTVTPTKSQTYTPTKLLTPNPNIQPKFL